MAWTLTEDLHRYVVAAGDFLRSRPVQNTVQLAVVETPRARGGSAFGEIPPAELRARIPGVLRCVDGVTDVVEDDREVWLVAGTPSAEALVRAAAVVVDDMADRARAHIEASFGGNRPRAPR